MSQCRVFEVFVGRLDCSVTEVNYKQYCDTSYNNFFADNLRSVNQYSGISFLMNDDDNMGSTVIL